MTELSTMTWMAVQAARLGAVVMGSLAIEEAGHYYNRLIWMQPDGNFEQYDKRHLFQLFECLLPLDLRGQCYSVLIGFSMAMTK